MRLPVFVNCPNCAQQADLPRALLGLDWVCPRCGNAFALTGLHKPLPPTRQKFILPWGSIVLCLAGLVVAMFTLGLALSTR